MDLFASTRLADSSKRLFNDKLRQFIAMMPQANRNIDAIVDNPEMAARTLSAQTTITQSAANRHLYYSAVVAYLKHTDAGKRRSEPLKQRWEKIQKTNWEERRQQNLNNEPSADQLTVAQQVKWADVVRVRDTLPRGSSERLLLSLYTYLPPLRADYYEVRINPPLNQRTATATTNFLVLGPTAEASTLVIRDFKTAAKYKEIKHTLPQPLYDEIRASLVAKPRNYLFVMPSDTTRPYDRNGFSKWANKQLQLLFKVPITLTSLRHLYISTLDFNRTRAGDLEKIGNSMGHSISMQKGYQWIEPNT